LSTHFRPAEFDALPAVGHVGAFNWERFCAVFKTFIRIERQRDGGRFGCRGAQHCKKQLGCSGQLSVAVLQWYRSESRP
jgi:hypothetical protein